MKLTQALGAPAALVLLGCFPPSTAVLLTPPGSKFSDELQAAALDDDASFAQTAVALGGKKNEEGEGGKLKRRGAVKRKGNAKTGAAAAGGGEQAEAGGGGEGEGAAPAAPTGGPGEGGGSPVTPMKPFPAKAAAVLGATPAHQKPREFHRKAAGEGQAEGGAGGAGEGQSFLQFRRFRGWINKKRQGLRSGRRGSYEDNEGGVDRRPLSDEEMEGLPRKARRVLGVPYSEQTDQTGTDQGQMD